jgi:hypothetical protein
VSRRRLVPLVLAGGVLALAYNAVVLTRELGGAPRPIAAGDDEALGEAIEGESEGEAPEEPLGALSRQELEAYLAGLPGDARNPFLAPGEESGGSEPARPGAPLVSGTLTSSWRRVAWIDGVPRGGGERIGDLELVRIERERVVVRRGEERLELDVMAAAPPAAIGEEE